MQRLCTHVHAFSMNINTDTLIAVCFISPTIQFDHPINGYLDDVTLLTYIEFIMEKVLNFRRYWFLNTFL